MGKGISSRELILYSFSIGCITILEILNLLYGKLDGNIFSAVIAAIVAITLRQYYKGRVGA